MVDIFKQVITSSIEKEENYIIEVLKRNYPDYDLSTIDGITKLMNEECIYIERKKYDLEIEENTFRATTEIKIYKQLL